MSEKDKQMNFQCSFCELKVEYMDDILDSDVLNHIIDEHPLALQDFIEDIFVDISVEESQK